LTFFDPPAKLDKKAAAKKRANSKKPVENPQLLIPEYFGYKSLRFKDRAQKFPLTQ
jgi:hypothetical protein